MAQIDARLAELAELAELAAARQAAAPPAPRAAPATYVPVMRRVAKVTLAMACIDLAQTIHAAQTANAWRLDLSGVVLTLMLAFGGLRIAELVRWCSWAAAPVWAAYALLMLTQPLDLTLTQLRLTPGWWSLAVLLPLLKMGVAIWTARELGSEPLMQARALERRKVRNMRIPLGLGVLSALAWCVLSTMIFGGERARHAEQLAAQRGGAQYRYHTASLQVVQSSGQTRVFATVSVWNDHAVHYMAVNWKE